MALLVLLSTFSYTLNRHYCGDFLVDSAWFLEAQTCTMWVPSEQHSHDNSINKNTCCENESWSIEGQHDLKIAFEDFSPDQQVFLIAFAFTFANLFEGIEAKDKAYHDYSPPPLIKDVQILHQTFLI